MTTPDPAAGESRAYEVYAIKYAEADALPADKVVIGGDPHEARPRDMAYYVWLIRRADLAIVVDTGFNAASEARRGRRLVRSPVGGLRALGVEPEAVRTLIVTHLHYDYIGNAGLFPNATLHIQDKKVVFRHSALFRSAPFCAPPDFSTRLRTLLAGDVIEPSDHRVGTWATATL